MRVVRIYVAKDDQNSSPSATSHISRLGGWANIPHVPGKLLLGGLLAGFLCAITFTGLWMLVPGMICDGYNCLLYSLFSNFGFPLLNAALVFLIARRMGLQTRRDIGIFTTMAYAAGAMVFLAHPWASYGVTPASALPVQLGAALWYVGTPALIGAAANRRFSPRARDH